MNSKAEFEAYCQKHIGGFSSFTSIQDKVFSTPDFWGAERDFFITAPTASGKSLIAYAAMSQRKDGKPLKSLYVVPFRSLASQKYAEIQEFFAKYKTYANQSFETDKIYLSTSEHSVDDRNVYDGNASIAVTIYEKLFLFMNQDENFLTKYDLVIMDEFGIVSDEERGLKIDFMYMECLLHPSLRLIALSTPFYNWDAYLGCSNNCVYISDEKRPHALIHKHFYQKPWREYITKDMLQDLDGAFAANVLKSVRDKDDLIAALCWLEYEKENSVLVFCRNRNRTRNLVNHIYKFFVKNGVIPTYPRIEIEEDFQQVYERVGISTGDMYGLFEDDENSHGALIGNLKDAFLQGITFHNASQPHNLRADIEEQLLGKDGDMRIVVATDTLAYGINSGVSSVIIDARQPGEAPMTQYEYLNYCGRAGRYEDGTVYTIYNNEAEYLEMQTTLRGEYHHITSMLTNGRTQSSLAFYILTLLNRRKRTLDDIVSYMGRFPIDLEQGSDGILRLISESVDQLLAHDMVRYGSEDDFEEDILFHTDLGKAVCGYILDFPDFDCIHSFVTAYSEDAPFYLFDYFCMLSSLKTFRYNRYFDTEDAAVVGHIFEGLYHLFDTGCVGAELESNLRTTCQYRDQRRNNQVVRNGWLHSDSPYTVSGLRQSLIYTNMMMGASTEDLYHIGKITSATIQGLMGKLSYYSELALALAKYHRKTRLASHLKAIIIGLSLGGVPYELIYSMDDSLQSQISASDADVLKQMYQYKTLLRLSKRTAEQNEKCKILRTATASFSEFHQSIWESYRLL